MLFLMSEIAHRIFKQITNISNTNKLKVADNMIDKI
jgi:hypothetical protein